jgi:hypothetical protein
MRYWKCDKPSCATRNQWNDGVLNSIDEPQPAPHKLARFHVTKY